MIAGPIFLLACLLGSAGLLYLLRRFEGLAALLAALVTTMLALLLWRLPLETPVRLAGRLVWLGQRVTWQGLSLQISPAVASLLIFLLIVSALAFLLAWRTYQGRTFYPFGLGLLALWAGVGMLQPLELAPTLIVLAAIAAVFLIQAGKPGDVRGAWRQLLFPTLAAPLFLLAAWYLEQAPLNPEDAMPYEVASWLLIGGFVLLLQPAPLHVAVPAVARQAPPVVATFLWVGKQGVTLFLLQRFLVTYPWLEANVDIGRWLLWLGVLTALLAGALAATQDRLGRFVGYAGLYDYGVLLVAVALGGTAGLPTAVWLLLTRTLALFTVAAGAALIRHHLQGDALPQLSGAVSRLPIAVAALIVGGFALAGMPLTGQFASHWALMQLLAENDPRWTLLLLAGATGVVLGTVRMGRACFGELRGSPVERESSRFVILGLALVVLNAALGVSPQLLTAPVANAILPLSTFGP